MKSITNQQRAGWAACALATFREKAGDYDTATPIQDLIADLGHLARCANLDFARIAARGISTWAYEHRESNGESYSTVPGTARPAAPTACARKIFAIMHRAG